MKPNTVRTRNCLLYTRCLQGPKEDGEPEQIETSTVCDPVNSKGHPWKRGAVTFAVAPTTQSALTSISALQENQTNIPVRVTAGPRQELVG